MIHKFGIFLTGVQINKRDIKALILAYFTLSSWYCVFSYYILSFFVDKTTQTFSNYNSIFNLLVALTLILSHLFIHRVDKISIVYVWSVFSSIGTISTFLAPTVMFKLSCYFLSGIVFGVGLLAYFVFFWDLTVPEERGRVAGLVGSFSLLVFPFILLLLSELSFVHTVMACIILSIGSIVNRLSQKKNPFSLRKATKIDQSIDRRDPESRTVILYTIPWIIFCLINVTLAKTISFHISQYLSLSLVSLLVIVQIISGGIGTIMGGVIADFFGRKKSLILGLTLYGLSLTISGMAKNNVLFYLSYIGIGLTWGIFLTMYTFLIWGDLADNETSTKRYSIGLAIYYLSMSIGTLFSHQLVQVDLYVASIASCLLIFLSNIPLLIAPELLSHSFHKRIDLALYLRNIIGKKQ